MSFDSLFSSLEVARIPFSGSDICYCVLFHSGYFRLNIYLTFLFPNYPVASRAKVILSAFVLAHGVKSCLSDCCWRLRLASLAEVVSREATCFTSLSQKASDIFAFPTHVFTMNIKIVCLLFTLAIYTLNHCFFKYTPGKMKVMIDFI